MIFNGLAMVLVFSSCAKATDGRGDLIDVFCSFASAPIKLALLPKHWESSRVEVLFSPRREMLVFVSVFALGFDPCSLLSDGKVGGCDATERQLL